MRTATIEEDCDLRKEVPMRAHDTPEPDLDETLEPEVVYISTSEWLTIFKRYVDEVLGIAPDESVRRNTEQVSATTTTPRP